MKDAKEIIREITGKDKEITFSALVSDLRGMELAIESSLNEVITIINASNAHNKKFK